MEILKGVKSFELPELIEFIDAAKNSLCIIDKDLTVIAASEGFLEQNGCTHDEFIGKTVYELEENNIFKPSVGRMCYEKRNKVTIMQKNTQGDDVLSTAVPIFNDLGEIKNIICYNTIDIANHVYTSDKLEKARELIHDWSKYVNQKKMEKMMVNELSSRSKRMDNILTLIDQIADTNANIVITGETGVGKSLSAKIIHDKSSRREEAFIQVDCGAIPPNLIESELFGYEAGAFTGASSKGKKGYIECAHKGTLFLDEIAEIPYGLQSKLLQVVQERKITRVGGNKQISVDFRLITATNKNLEEEVRKGTFREDLYYRLNVIPFRIPSIRERPEDVFPLVMTFLNRFNIMYGKNVEITAEAMKIIEAQNWPGNVRQIENMVERLVILSKDNTVTVGDFLLLMKADESGKENMSLKEMMEEYEKRIILDYYDKYGSSVAVAKALNIGQSSASRKILKYISK